MIPGVRDRVRPSKKGLALSASTFGVALLLAFVLPFSSFFEPLAGIVIVGAVLTAFRWRNLRRSLPPPHGGGRVAVIDARRAARTGMLITFGAGAMIIGLFGIVYLLPPELYFVVLFGVMAGFPLSQILYFAILSTMEKAYGGRIYRITEEAEEGGETVLRKSLELTTRR